MLALVGGTAAYLHADVAAATNAPTQGADRVSAAALHEVAPLTASVPDETPAPTTQDESSVSSPAEMGVTPTVPSDPATLVYVFHDGHTTPVITTARTVVGALTDAHIALSSKDIVKPARTAPPAIGTAIHIVRVVVRVEHTKTAIDFHVSRVADSSLYRGQSTTIKPGRRGIARLTYRVVLHDGKVATRTLTKTTVLRVPITQVVHYGTKRKTTPSRAHRSVDSLNWHALAECESGNNPRSVGGGGKYFGLYQFTLGTWHSVGGAGNPRDAARAEQTKRAKILYQRRGAAPWPVCGSRLFT